MTIWFTGDQHFGGKRILDRRQRPFSTTQDMTAVLIRNFNARVHHEDATYHLGNFSYSHLRAEDVLSRLRGRHFLVPGHSDPCHPWHSKTREEMSYRYRRLGFLVLPPIYERQFAGLGRALLSHLPFEGGVKLLAKYESYRPKDKSYYRCLLHGSAGALWKKQGKMINVGVDAWDFAPVSLEELTALLALPESQEKPSCA